MKRTERKGDSIQQKGAESERQLRNIMHNCSVNENLRRPLLPTKCKSSPYPEPGNISQRHPLPVKSLSDLVLHSSRQVIESKSSSTKIIKKPCLDCALHLCQAAPSHTYHGAGAANDSLLCPFQIPSSLQQSSADLCGTWGVC